MCIAEPVSLGSLHLPGVSGVLVCVGALICVHVCVCVGREREKEKIVRVNGMQSNRICVCVRERVSIFLWALVSGHSFIHSFIHSLILMLLAVTSSTFTASPLPPHAYSFAVRSTVHAHFSPPQVFSFFKRNRKK